MKMVTADDAHVFHSFTGLRRRRISYYYKYQYSNPSVA